MERIWWAKNIDQKLYCSDYDKVTLKYKVKCGHHYDFGEKRLD